MEYNIYMLAGLGFDCRFFQRLQIPAKNIYHLNWLAPNKGESFDSYLDRMAEQIKDKSLPIVYIGHSMGGVGVQELHRRVPAQQSFILSSMKAAKEKSSLSIILKIFPIYWLVVSKWMTLKTFWIWGRWFGYRTPEAKALFKEMVQCHSNYYFRWAISRLLKWEKTPNSSENLVHIQGDKDKIFPIRKMQNVIAIKGGTHTMAFNKAEEITAIINQHLEQTFPKEW